MGLDLNIWGYIAVIASPVIFLFISFVVHFVYFIVKGYRLPKSLSTYKKPSVIKRVWFDFPRQFWLDRFLIDPNQFNEYGLHLFCGEQGSGKTTAVVHLLHKLKARYPRIRVRTNFNYTEQYGPINTWQELVKNENGIFGQVEVIDEIQTWFNSMMSKDFPPEMLTEISQQRKQRKMLVGTAQVFGRVAKPIREQTSFVYLPMTFAGCFTIVRVSKPEFYSETDFKFKKFIKTYFFVHNDSIRNSFDTYKKIEGMVKAGFHVRPEFHGQQESNVVYLKK